MKTEREMFEDWYATHAFDYATNPIGSRECSLQWEGWQARAKAEPSYQTLLNMLMEANGVLRSCFQVAERMAVMFGAENGANWNALHGQLDKTLNAQHAALRAESERRAGEGR